MMTIDQLASDLSELIRPFLSALLTEKASELAKHAANTAFQTARNAWELLRGPIEATPKAYDAAQKLAADPADADYQRLFVAGLGQALKAHPELVRDLTALIKAQGDARANLQKVTVTGSTTGDVKSKVSLLGRLFGGRTVKQEVTITNSKTKDINTSQ